MAIPAIAPYSMPVEPEIPRNQAAWLPDAARAALLIHDMQRYFIDFFPPGEPPVTRLIANIQVLREAATRMGLPVIYTAQPGGMTSSQRGLLKDFWGPGMSTDPHATQIVEELAPRATDTVLTKWRYSAFYRTNLKTLLDTLHRDELIICGVYAHIGCLLTACDSFTADIRPFIVADAVADFSADDHLLALRYTVQRCGSVLTTRKLIKALQETCLGSSHGAASAR